MFTKVPQPLRYAEALLRRYNELAAACGQELLAELVRALAELADCELGQLYLLDHTHTRLTLTAEWLDGKLQPREAASLPSDYDGEQLLQYCLNQNRVLSIDELGADLYSITFLPDGSRPWRSLLCLPWSDSEGQTRGLLLVASHARRTLQGFASSFGQLGSFALAQLQRLQPPGDLPGDAVATESPPSNHYGLLGRSNAMRQVYRLIDKILHCPVNVLIQGETGTGKELVARAIHEHGERRNQAFVVQNCAALPENLLESELFGYRRGAFTGAERDKRGLFDVADGGTLFLDEIGDMPLILQGKLLRVLQEGEVRPLGSDRTHKVDVRIITATHRDLQQLVESGQFREDLFYRLSHFPIVLPPLRQRGKDLLQLARHFARTACSRLKRDPCRWSKEALEHLTAYPFPGNVRELKGHVERAVLLCEGGELLPEHFNLKLPPRANTPHLTLRERLERIERELLLDCLRKNLGNQTNAANELGLPRRTLVYRLQRLNIGSADL